ncbi:hypothetical protein B0H17DRAFT_1202139 [Mycena rosella]|uniref:Uncharacterized protein n=1 Tax=Mycena rosella TaxID=1033263 RepID=A0AAD7DF32_MYCRO|nr:hypothetical protein B0H17DRAFT_1202139 [Mycena rosella]
MSSRFSTRIWYFLLPFIPICLDTHDIDARVAAASNGVLDYLLDSGVDANRPQISQSIRHLVIVSNTLMTSQFGNPVMRVWAYPCAIKFDGTFGFSLRVAIFRLSD